MFDEQMTAIDKLLLDMVEFFLSVVNSKLSDLQMEASWVCVT